MHMHLSTRQISFLGLMLALAVILNILSGVIDSSTLFLLSAASFFIGIAFRETSRLLGVGFYLASVLLSFILAPNKMYCVTYSVIGLYVVIRELICKPTIENKEISKTVSNINNEKKRFLIIKFIIFNIIYVPILFLFPQLFIARELSSITRIIFLLLGQVGFIIYDKAYDYFMIHYWGKYRKNLYK